MKVLINQMSGVELVRNFGTNYINWGVHLIYEFHEATPLNSELRFQL